MAARWIIAHHTHHTGRWPPLTVNDESAQTPSSETSKKLRMPFVLPRAASAITHKVARATATFEHKAAKAKLVDSWWMAYYRQRKNDLRTLPRQMGRSDKHDYRNPASKYENDIVDRLRRTHAEEAEELDRHHKLHPFLSKDYLKALQQFRLLPPWDEADDDDYGQTRRRVRSDASELRSRPSSMMPSSEDEDSDRQASTPSNSVGDVSKSTHPSPHLTNAAKLALPKRIRRWTYNSGSFRAHKGSRRATFQIVRNASCRQVSPLR